MAIWACLKKEHSGGGDLGKPRINVSGTVKQVRLWAVPDFAEICKAPSGVINLALKGMASRNATMEIQEQRWNRNVFTNSAVEKATAIVTELPRRTLNTSNEHHP